MDVDGAGDGVSGDPDIFLDKIVEFQDGSQFERLERMTDFRKDPGEARVLYLCRRIDGEFEGKNHEFVMKVKVQWPGPQDLIHEGHSPHTAAELKALQKFNDSKTSGVPHLVVWKRTTQGESGLHPGGYISFTVMTKMPGETLWDLRYWSLTADEREEIRQVFMRKLQEIRLLDIAPYDCALRNILLDTSTKQLSVVDFEHYTEGSGAVTDENDEFQKWGLVQRPPPRTWFQEWGLKGI